MKLVDFNILINQTIIATDHKASNRVIFITELEEDELRYYWLDARVTGCGITRPELYELTVEEYQSYMFND